jgi:hypothetical protein
MNWKIFAAGIAFLALATATHARTIENALFTCEGELTQTTGDGGKTYYGVVESWKDDDPVDCEIEDGKALKQILAVCHVGDYCVVAAKGERGNGGHNVIQKAFEVQRQPASVVQDLKRNSKQ